ncbi:DUF421 domain-containing protein [Brevundimonas sp. FT23042]|uniref:DUF421 domain-containing protein n=1 Tax=Brevundimonas sp. FT23042 TaxID=3393749 RepID=UPI003B587C48
MNWTSMLFQGWPDLARTVVVAILAYGGLVLFLRLSGKRTLSKLNAFDLVVTVALGSTLSTILLNEQVALAEGLVAFASLIMLQYVVAWSSSRSDRLSRLVRSEPTLLLRHGQLIGAALERERVTPGEAHAAIRRTGGLRLQDAEAVFLETDGQLSVILKRPEGGSGPSAVEPSPLNRSDRRGLRP